MLRILRLLALVVITLASPVSAQVVPVVVDDTDDEAAWWVDSGAPTGACLQAMVDEAGWLDPAALGDASSISRVYRRADITASNARQVAGLLGAAAVVHGRVSTLETSPAAWTGRMRVEVALDARWMSVRGSAERALELHGVGIAESADEALRIACERLAEGAGRVLRASVTSSADTWDAAPLQRAHIVVQSDGQALGYVGVRRALREELGAGVVLQEVWASEGAIGLAVQNVEPVAAQDAALQLAGLAVDDGVVDSASEDNGMVILVVRGLPAMDR